jgi:hypothetical protein
MKRIGLFLFASALLFASGFTPAQAETVACTAITSLPYVIVTQGVYCLTGHLNTGISTGNAITINTNNVVLDLNGFKIGGLSAGLGTQAYGISGASRQNVTIRNGTVRGFYFGIKLDDTNPPTISQGHVIEDIRADQNTVGGIEIWGKGNTIRNNIVMATGGSTNAGAPLVVSGISVQGPGARVINNDVMEVTADGSHWAFGIFLGSSNSVVVGNRVTNVTAATVNSFGIGFAVGSSDVLVSGNLVSSTQNGIAIGAGTGKYMNNLTMGVISPYVGGTAAGETNY